MAFHPEVELVLKNHLSNTEVAIVRAKLDHDGAKKHVDFI